MGYNCNRITLHFMSKGIVVLCLIYTLLHSLNGENVNVESDSKAEWLHNSDPPFQSKIDDGFKSPKAFEKQMVIKIENEKSNEDESTSNSIEAPQLHETQDFQGQKIYEQFLQQLVPSIEHALANKLDLDVITQAFRFVKLDSHLNAVVSQLNRMQNTYEMIQGQTMKQEAKFDLLLDQIKSLVDVVAGASGKVNAVEEKIETKIRDMRLKLDEAVEKIIQSSTTSHMMFELSKESLQHMDKMEVASKEVLKEVKAVKTELGDVGQVSIQTIYNLNKLEENLMAELLEAGNRTVYALRQDAKIIGPTVLLDTYEGNSIQYQADGSNQQNSGGFLHSSKKLSVPVGGNNGGIIKAKSLVSCHPKRLINEKRPRDCGEIQLLGHLRSGVYTIFPSINSDHPAKVFCDLDTEGGGWTVLQRRMEQEAPKESFNRTWQEYQEGFGSPQSQYWLGLQNIAAISEAGDQTLRIELTDWSGESRNANYAYLRISNSTEKYRLHVADYSGSVGDSLSFHNGMPFSTKDNDNDLEKSVNCAEKFQGGWWFKNCHMANLNGVYMGESSKGQHNSYAMGISWYSWHGYYYSIRRVEMKIRSRFFSISPLPTVK